jgi:Lon protease-like protein
MNSMSTNPFAPSDLVMPERLAVFPLTGVLLMPFGQLPLNIFEPRYLAMVDDAMAGSRMIGMIQPKAEGSEDLYDVGCAGKITDFSETEDGRYLITLSGVSRFKVKAEHKTDKPYRVVDSSWADFEKDLSRKQCLDVDRERLMGLLSSYFDQEEMSCDFTKFENVPDGKLMTCLSMVCPFEAREKQVLLEQVCCVERAKLFMTMLEMAIDQGMRPDMSKTSCH